MPLTVRHYAVSSIATELVIVLTLCPAGVCLGQAESTRELKLLRDLQFHSPLSAVGFAWLLCCAGEQSCCRLAWNGSR